jgi:protein-tyrosine phosphatase
VPPFTILHVCVGNICRSPMAERLLTLALRRQVGDRVSELYLSHGGGTGTWHLGEPMNPPAARQVRQRGGDPSGFRARQVTAAMIDSSDLILCATADQVARVLELRPSAEHRTFVLGEFGRLLADVDLGALPPPTGAPTAAYDRGVALVAAVDATRGGAPADGRARSSRRLPSPADNLTDPWGRPEREYARVADLIEATVGPLASALTGSGASPAADRR